jgi:Excreted virulence factor EspC, type VII ESX diderm
MTDGGTLQVDTDALRAHARDIAGVAQALGEAVEAGEATLDLKAFGMLLSFFVPLVVHQQEEGIRALKSAKKTLDALDLGLTASAFVFDTVDEVIDEGFAKVWEFLS